jgi:hypothetical protein
MNALYVGMSKDIQLPRGGFLFIGDEVPNVRRARIFDPAKHSFNPLKSIDYKKARELADVLYTIAPQGQDTLTVRNGKRALLQALLKAERLDEVRGDEEVKGMIGDLLASPVLSKMLCNPTNFSFAPNSLILARVDRAELGEYDALVLGLFLIGHFRGQLVIPDFGFYGREAHASLIREERLVAGVNFLGELSPKLRNAVLLIKDKQAKGATADDAETLALYTSKFARGTVGFAADVERAMGVSEV